MDSPKYIIFDGIATGLPDFVVVFPCCFQHKEIAEKFPMNVPISAGTVNFTKDGACCMGKSIGLNIWSRGETDESIIDKQYNLK